MRSKRSKLSCKSVQKPIVSTAKQQIREFDTAEHKNFKFENLQIVSILKEQAYSVKITLSYHFTTNKKYILKPRTDQRQI